MAVKHLQSGIKVLNWQASAKEMASFLDSCAEFSADKMVAKQFDLGQVCLQFQLAQTIKGLVCSKPEGPLSESELMEFVELKHATKHIPEMDDLIQPLFIRHYQVQAQRGTILKDWQKASLFVTLNRMVYVLQREGLEVVERMNARSAKIAAEEDGSFRLVELRTGLIFDSSVQVRLRFLKGQMDRVNELMGILQRQPQQ